jgi:CheY-like chemotaxis protein
VRGEGAPTPVVLVVEDEAVIRAMLAEELEDAGFAVIEADGADAAVAAFAGRNDIGIVVTDVRMPGSMDGIGLARWMREHAPAVPIIITSGFATRLDATAINPAIVRVVAKPYVGRDIAEWMAALVSGTGTAQGARR